MLNINLDKENGIAFFEPDSKLSVADFTSATRVIDAFIEDAGKLKGLIIVTQQFPSWDSFAALLSHLSFVKDHHEQVLRVAFVTDSSIGILAEHVAKHFISAEIKSFKYNKLQEAQQWIIDSDCV
jgi:hypothetical protein